MDGRKRKTGLQRIEFLRSEDRGLLKTIPAMNKTMSDDVESLASAHQVI